MVTKSQIRKELLHKRDAISPEVWSEKTTDITRKILRSELYGRCDCLLIYADYHGEVGTDMLIEKALMDGKKVYLPKVLEGFEEARMEFYQIQSTYELLEGYKGIKEPTGNLKNVFRYEDFSGKKNLMLVPGVAFDKSGGRLGYGKGYYDNYLKAKSNLLTVGICFSFQIRDELPLDNNDIKLDYLIHENTLETEIANMKYK